MRREAMNATSPPDGSPASPGRGEQGEPARPLRVALSRDLEQTRQRLDSLDALMRDLTKNLTALAEHLVAAPGPPAIGGGRSVDWPKLPSSPAEAALAEAHELIQHCHVRLR
jgi:hypothetical protein